MPATVKTQTHDNDERTVHCPVEGCDATPLARGVNLHILRSSGNGHGDQNEVPDHIDLDNLETAGEQSVSMDYPESRDTERVVRLCPYCDKPFRGKMGVQIHLGQMEGKKNHPRDASDRHDLEDFAVVHMDEDGNVVEVVQEGPEMPSTRDRRRNTFGARVETDPERVEEVIESLRDRGLDAEADRMERLMLGDDAEATA